MAHFFFDVFNDDTTIDEEGVDLATADDARAYAVAAARELVAERAIAGSLHRHHRIQVRDSGDNVVFSVRFDEAVQMLP